MQFNSFSNDIMVDIETFATKPNTGTMVEIAAVRFDAETFLPLDDGFYVPIALVPSRIIDPDTLTWWAKTIPDRLTSYLSNQSDAKSPREALNLFYSYCRNPSCPWPHGAQDYKDAWLWAKPTTFDISFIFSYMEEFIPRDSNHPMWDFFSRRKVTDVRSFMGGKGCKNSFKSHIPLGYEKNDHDPLYDCLEQINSMRQTLINKGLLTIESRV